MISLALKRLKDERLLVRLIAVGSTSALAAFTVDVSNGSASSSRNHLAVSVSDTPTYCRKSQLLSWGASITECEETNKETSKDQPTTTQTGKLSSATIHKQPSWMRRTLAYLHIKRLPMPRLLAKGDPVFRMDPRLLQKRQEDELKMQNLVRGALQERNPETLKALNQKCLELAYGEDVTLKNRQDFVHVSTCSAQT